MPTRQKDLSLSHFLSFPLSISKHVIHISLYILLFLCPLLSCPSFIVLFPFSLSLFQKSAPSFVSLSNVSCRRKAQIHAELCLSKDMEVDWDLHAVVRGCTTASSSATTASSSSAVFTTPTTSSGSSIKSEFSPQSCLSSFPSEQVGQLFSLADPFEARISGNIGELHELFRPFFPKSQPLYSPQGAPISSLSSQSVSKEQTQLKQFTKQSQAVSMTSNTNTQTTRSKRRKNQLKKICHVPAEALSSDVWAWRKYGQKPIKGSPYPRGYYRCSSSKGCLARKQVERNRSDPRMFIVTYTAEHNHPAPTHRNSLAGSTRQKTFTPQTVTAGDSDKASPTTPPKATCSSPATSLEDELQPLSTNTESREDKYSMEDDEVEQEEDFGGLSDMAVSDDFFAGLEEFAGGPTNGTGDLFSDHFTGNFALPWFSSGAATAAGGV